jgi:hypothetical protein
MATTLPRTTVTHVPRVQRLLDAGHRLFPGESDREVLLDLAERGLEASSRRGVAGLMVLPGPGRTVTADEIEDALLDD